MQDSHIENPDRQLKVLIISKQYPPIIGGGGSHAYYLARELSLKEWVQVYVLTSSIGTKPPVHDHREDKEHPRNLIEYRVDFGNTQSLHYENAIKKGLELCNNVKPDVIHGQHIAGSLIGLHLKAAFNKPLVVTLHKTPIEWDDTKTQTDPIYSYIKCLSQLEIIDIFIACSKVFKQELINVGVKDTKIELIYHGVPIEWYKGRADKQRIFNIRKQLKLNPDDNLIICPSRLDEERKDLPVFVKAAGELNKKIRNKKFIFLITGVAKKENEKEKRHKKELEAIASDYRIKSRLKFSSFKEDELPALNRLAKACVLPSRREGLGLVLLEALAVRTPIVGSNVSGINEVIETNGEHGLLFTDGNYTELAEQLEKLFTNEDLSRKLKKEGFKRLKRIFNAKIMIDKHLKVYRELINKKGQTN